MVGKALEHKCYPSDSKRTTRDIDGPIQNSWRKKRKYLECLKEIIGNNYTADFPEGIEIENQEEYMKPVGRTNKRKTSDSDDSDRVIDDETDDVICID